jgi:hypothetical protein
MFGEMNPRRVLQAVSLEGEFARMKEQGIAKPVNLPIHVAYEARGGRLELSRAN